MIYLMNSAMMPNEGEYALKKISKEQFSEEVNQHKDAIVSCLGYPQNVELVEKWTGVRFPLNMRQTTFEDGDMALVLRLTYRTRDKGAMVNESDFEFFKVYYESSEKAKERQLQSIFQY